MNSTTLTFLGAAETVTGSKYLLSTAGKRFLIDAGIFQGEKEWRLRNWDEFPVPPDTISDILLTHAHADHCAYLPALVKQGFSGRIWCTEGTRRLTEIVLRDAGFLQEREASDARAGGYSKHDPPLPLYTVEDAEKTIRLLRSIPFDEDIPIGDDALTAHYVRAGHILGSASIHVRTADAEVVFSGDIGRKRHPVLRPPVVPRGAPYVLVESTYGDREHPEPVNLPHEALADAIRRTVDRDGAVLIPAFAVDRTESVLKVLAHMIEDGRIPDVPIYVNSPMALKALEAYSDHADDLRDDIRFDDVASMANLTLVTSPEESQALTSKPLRRAIVISSSGMMTGGRVVHHLAQMLPHRENTLVVTGYQAAGTRGRSLLDGARQLKMFGQYVPVLAEIVHDREFSVHADASEIIDWLGALTPRPHTAFCVHGEKASSEALAERITAELGIAAVVPHYGEVVQLSASTVPVPVDHPPMGPEVPIRTAAREAERDTAQVRITMGGRPVEALDIELEQAAEDGVWEGFVRIRLSPRAQRDE